MFDKKILKNYLYNSSLNLLNIIFPIISFPYISRVLGVEGLGEASFVLVFSGYFITIAALGIPIYGIREIGQSRENKKKLNELFSELFLLNIISVCFFILLYIYLIFNIEYLHHSLYLYLIVGINIILSFFQIDWLFQGLENYRIITIRSFFTKLLAFILMILLVKDSNDVDIYLIINVIALSLANIFNFIYAKKFVEIKFNNLNFKKHFKPIAFFFSTRIMSTIYTVLDTVLLGLLVGNFYVGLYIAAMRLNRAVVMVVTSLSAVLLPRSSNYLKNNQIDKYLEVTKGSFYFIILTSLSLAILLFVFSSEIMILFAGSAFEESILTMKILTLLIVIVALSNFTGVQVLYPNKQEKVVAKSIAIGAVVNLSLNLILIPIYKHNGAAVATIIAESLILLYQVINVRKVITLQLDIRRIIKIILGVVIWGIFIYTFKSFLLEFSFIYRLMVGLLFSTILYIFIFYFLKEQLILDIIYKVKKVKV
jgi:O-antigen/teichoic acid export membrane protein